MPGVRAVLPVAGRAGGGPAAGWLFEHARAGRLGVGLVRSAAAMAWRMARPWVFWREVRLHHSVVVSRLLLWVVAMTLGMHLASSIIGIIATQLYLLRAPSGTWEWGSAWHLNVLTAPVVLWSGWGGPWFLPGDAGLEWVSAGVAFALVWSVLVVVIPETRAKAKVHSGHLIRAGVYGLSWLGVLELARVMDFGWIAADALLVKPAAAPQSLSSVLLGPVGVLALIVWTAAWWRAVLVRGWGIPRASLVWAVLMIPAVLAGVVAWCLAYVCAAGRGW